MNIREIVRKIGDSWKPDLPQAEFDAFDAVERAVGARLPADMKWFYQFVGNGGEGSLKKGYLRVFRIEDLPALQLRYALPRWLPHGLMFAQDGDDGFGLDLQRGRDGSNYPVIRFSLSSRDSSEVEDVGRNFRDFMERWGVGG